MKKLYKYVLLFTVLTCAVTVICYNLNQIENSSLIQYKGNYYYYVDSYTCAVPQKKLGQIQISVAPYYSIDKNKKVTKVNYRNAALFQMEDDNSIYIMANEEAFHEDMPVYLKYKKGKAVKDSSREYSIPQKYIKFNDKLYEKETTGSKPYELDNEDCKKVGSIDTYYNFIPSDNFSTNIKGLLGTTLYQSENDPDVIYAVCIKDGIKKVPGKYSRFIYYSGRNK